MKRILLSVIFMIGVAFNVADAKANKMSRREAADIWATGVVAANRCDYLADHNVWSELVVASMPDFYDRPTDKKLVEDATARLLLKAMSMGEKTWCDEYNRKAISDINVIRSGPDANRQNVRAAICWFDNERLQKGSRPLDCPLSTDQEKANKK